MRIKKGKLHKPTFFIETSRQFESKTPNKYGETGEVRCQKVCETKYNVACKPPFKFRNQASEVCGVTAYNVTPQSEATLDLDPTGSDDILEEYSEFRGCRQQ